MNQIPGDKESPCYQNDSTLTLRLSAVIPGIRFYPTYGVAPAPVNLKMKDS